MMPENASKHQKFKWIEEGKYLDKLATDRNGWVKVKACKRRIELQQKKHVDDREELRGSMDADLFEVIQLSAKTKEQIHELISQNKFLTFFAKDHRIGIRIRAKRQMSEFLKENGSVQWWE